MKYTGGTLLIEVDGQVYPVVKMDGGRTYYGELGSTRCVRIPHVDTAGRRMVRTNNQRARYIY